MCKITCRFEKFQSDRSAGCFVNIPKNKFLQRVTSRQSVYLMRSFLLEGIPPVNLVAKYNIQASMDQLWPLLIRELPSTYFADSNQHYHQEASLIAKVDILLVQGIIPGGVTICGFNLLYGHVTGFYCQVKQYAKQKCDQKDGNQNRRIGDIFVVATEEEPTRHGVCICYFSNHSFVDIVIDR